MLDVKIVIAIFLGVLGVCQWQFILTLINEITWILDICVFITKQQYEEEYKKKVSPNPSLIH